MGDEGTRTSDRIEALDPQDGRAWLEAQGVRAGIASGTLRGSALLELLLSVPARDRDTWIDGVLGIESPPPDALDLPRGSVPYLPCGVDEILSMLRDAPLREDDELVDLGSGLGRVLILAHLLCGARGRGVEIQEHLVRRARQVCAALGLAGVSFVHGNAAETELDGSVFFLYAPFNGAMLTAVVERIEEVARRRAIVVCTVGVELQGVTWLRARGSSMASVCLYDAGVGRSVGRAADARLEPGGQSTYQRR